MKVLHVSTGNEINVEFFNALLIYILKAIGVFQNYTNYKTAYNLHKCTYVGALFNSMLGNVT